MFEISSKTILEAFGINKMPWFIRVYLLLFFVFCALLIFSVLVSTNSVIKDYSEENPAIKLFSLSMDGLKIILGALMGALSLAVEKNLKTKNSQLPKKEDDEK